MEGDDEACAQSSHASSWSALQATKEHEGNERRPLVCFPKNDECTSGASGIVSIASSTILHDKIDQIKGSWSRLSLITVFVVMKPQTLLEQFVFHI